MTHHSYIVRIVRTITDAYLMYSATGSSAVRVDHVTNLSGCPLFIKIFSRFGQSVHTNVLWTNSCTDWPHGRRGPDGVPAGSPYDGGEWCALGYIIPPWKKNVEGFYFFLCFYLWFAWKNEFCNEEEDRVKIKQISDHFHQIFAFFNTILFFIFKMSSKQIQIYILCMDIFSRSGRRRLPMYGKNVEGL